MLGMKCSYIEKNLMNLKTFNFFLHSRTIRHMEDFKFFLSPIIVAYLCSAIDIASIYQP